MTTNDQVTVLRGDIEAIDTIIDSCAFFRRTAEAKAIGSILKAMDCRIAAAERAATQPADEDRCLKMMSLVEDYMIAVDYHGGQNGAKCDAAIEAIGKYLQEIAAPISEDTAKPSDCSGDPLCCPDNEGRGCHCSDNSAARTPASVGSIEHTAIDGWYFQPASDWESIGKGTKLYIDSRIAAAPARSGKAALSLYEIQRNAAEAAISADLERRGLVSHPAGNSSAAPSDAAVVTESATLIVPHEMGYQRSGNDIATSYANGWNDCRATMLGEIPDDPTSDPAALAAPAPTAESLSVPEAVRIGLEAAFEEKEGWRTKVAAGVRALAAKESA